MPCSNVGKWQIRLNPAGLGLEITSEKTSEKRALEITWSIGQDVKLPSGSANPQRETG